MESVTDTAIEPRARITLLQSTRFGFPALSDGAMALVYAFAAVALLMPVTFLGGYLHAYMLLPDELFFGLLIEGGFLMMQGSLVDVATRLKKRPPVWAVIVIGIGLLIFSPYALDVVKLAWGHGGIALVPLAISLAGRFSVLWHMPDEPRVRKLAARALIANRITTGLGLLALVTAVLVAELALHRELLGPHVFFGAGALYFAIAAFDDWRVRGAKFAERPRTLFRFDPIGVEYLAPL